MGEKIKIYRNRNKLTQNQLAEKIGISSSYLQKLEVGERENPNIYVLDKLVKALNVNISDFISDIEKITLKIEFAFSCDRETALNLIEDWNIITELILEEEEC